MDFNYMRRRSVFDPPSQVGSYPPFDFNKAADEQNQNVTKLDTAPAPVASPDQSKFSSMYSDIANQQGGPANQKYRDFLDTNEPQRDNYQPSKMNRLSAILAGMSDGVKFGGGQGYKTAQGVLDEPYNEALGQYNNQGKKLEAAAGLEEKDMGRRVGILKDIIAQKHNEDTAAETAKYHEGLLANGRERNKRTGLHYADITDPTTGNRTSNVIGPDGTIGNFSLGKAGSSTQERIDEAGKKAGAESAATKKDKIEVAKAGIAARGDETRKTAREKFENITELLQWKKDNGINDKYKGIVNKDGQSIWVNTSDPSDFVISGKDFNKMSDADRQKAKIELKAAPGAPKQDTTKNTEVKRDKSGKPISTTTTTHTGPASKEEDLTKLPPPPGGKPGGKWMKLPSGVKVYQEPS